MLTHRDSLSWLATSFPAKVAVHNGDRTMTFAQLNSATDQLGAALLDQGMRPGDVVAWLGRNCLEYFVLYFATAKAGLIIAPLNYWFRADDLALALDPLNAGAIVAQDRYVDVVESILDGPASRPTLRISVGGRPTGGWLDWTTLIDGSGHVVGVANDEHAPHEIIFTSGTTGRPKPVIRSQRKRVLDSYLSAIAFGLNRFDHMIHLGPQFHIGGMAMANQVLYVGGSVSISEFEPELIAHAIGDGVTFMAGVPTHFSMLIDSGLFERIDTTGVRGVKLAGSGTPPTLYDRVRAALPNADLTNGWGMTETGPHTLAIRGRDFDAHPDALGTPVPGSAVRVSDSAGADVPAGATGELRVRGETVLDAYFGDEQLTRAAFDEDGWFKTGDLGFRDDEGYFYLAGRASDMIITGGENVHPREIENVLTDHPAVAEAVVFGIADPRFVERVAAVVRLHPDVQPVDQAELVAHTRSRVAGYKTPSEIHFVHELPRTATGKIARTIIAEQFGRPHDGARADD